tara:strand:- start:817 stop:978 length:162 start_codon:yes stop_codon:yes gene_type:complete
MKAKDLVYLAIFNLSLRFSRIYLRVAALTSDGLKWLGKVLKKLGVTCDDFRNV